MATATAIATEIRYSFFFIRKTNHLSFFFLMKTKNINGRMMESLVFIFHWILQCIEQHIQITFTRNYIHYSLFIIIIHMLIFLIFKLSQSVRIALMVWFLRKTMTMTQIHFKLKNEWIIIEPSHVPILIGKSFALSRMVQEYPILHYYCCWFNSSHWINFMIGIWWNKRCFLL